MGQILSLLFSYNDDFGIKYPTKVDILLNKETKPSKNQKNIWRKSEH